MKWSPTEVAFLRKRYGKMHAGEIAKHLGRSRWSVYSKALHMGLRPQFIIPASELDRRILEILKGRPRARTSVIAKLALRCSWHRASPQIQEIRRKLLTLRARGLVRSEGGRWWLA